MYASQLIAYDLTHIFTLLRAPYSQVVNSLCALYTSVYSMELWKHLQHLTVLASKEDQGLDQIVLALFLNHQ